MLGLLEERFKRGLVGYWPMNEAAWDGTANEIRDQSGTGAHGNLTGSADTATGKVNRCAAFVDSSWVTIGAGHAALAINGDLTVAAWIKTSNSTRTAMMIFDDGGLAATTNYGLKVASGILIYAHGNGVAEEVETSATGVATGNWIHVVAVCDSQTTRFYFDGEAGATSVMTVDNIASGTSRRISSNNNAIDNFDGEIDEVALWNRALTANEVKEMYNSYIGRRLQFNPNVKGMVDVRMIGDMTEEM